MSSPCLCFPSLPTQNRRVQSPVGELWRETDSVKRQKCCCPHFAPLAAHLSFHVANFYGDSLQNFDFKSISKCSHQVCNANAMLVLLPNCVCSFVQQNRDSKENSPNVFIPFCFSFQGYKHLLTFHKTATSINSKRSPANILPITTPMGISAFSSGFIIVTGI